MKSMDVGEWQSADYMRYDALVRGPVVGRPAIPYTKWLWSRTAPRRDFHYFQVKNQRLAGERMIGVNRHAGIAESLDFDRESSRSAQFHADYQVEIR